MKLSRILLYPIKSLDGLEVSEAEVTALGTLRHDREWALVDGQGNFINGKKEPRLHQIRARFDLGCTEVSLSTPAFPALTLPLNELPPIAEWFSQVLQEPVRLIRDPQQGFPDDLEANGPTLVSEASLAEVGRWFGLELEPARKRFRTNLELSGLPAFWEDRLVGVPGSPIPFQIGKLNLLGMNPCQRCNVPTRDPETGVPQPEFPKVFAESRERTLPAWAERSRFDHFYRFALNTQVCPGQMGQRIRLGDPIMLPSLKP